jgi:hypothetical protein
MSMTVKDIPCGIFNVSGSLGFEVGMRPALFGLYIGYPETLKAGKIFGIFEVGVGMGFKLSGEDSFIMWKMEVGAGLDLDIGIVFASAYFRYGTDGELHWTSKGITYFEYRMWAEGQVKGGIWFFGKRPIINIYGRAEGKMIYDISKSKKYRIEATMTLRYSVSLLVASIKGSFDWQIGTSF